MTLNMINVQKNIWIPQLIGSYKINYDIEIKQNYVFSQNTHDIEYEECNTKTNGYPNS